MCYKTQGHYKVVIYPVFSTPISVIYEPRPNQSFEHDDCALCKVQQVAYTKLAAAFDTEERIELVKADREFVGSESLEYLNAMGIHYHIRIRENFKVVRL